MNRQHIIPRSQLYSVVPKRLAQLHISDEMLGDEFDWDESTSQYEGESMANDMLGFLKEFGAE